MAVTTSEASVLPPVLSLVSLVLVGGVKGYTGEPWGAERKEEESQARNALGR